MNVLLISANTEQFNMPAMPLVLACVVEAAINAGHEVTMLDLMFKMDVNATLKNIISEFRLECIGISVRNIDDQNIETHKFLLDKVKSVEESLAFADSLKLDTLRLTAGISIYPGTQLAEIAESQGVITSKSNLLYPHFYLSQELEGWLPEKLKGWRASRTNVIM